MQDSILRLESATVDVVIKITRSPKLSTGGRIFSTFRRRMLKPFPGQLPTAGWMWILRSR